MWSVMNGVCYERGLLWTGLLWTGSVLSGLFWTDTSLETSGLNWTHLRHNNRFSQKQTDYTSAYQPVGREAISGGSRSISKCYSFLLDREIIALSLRNKYATV